MTELKALEIANAVAFVARMRVRSARRPSERSRAIGAEEAALQIVKEIAAAQADVPAIQPRRMPDREAIARAIYDVETDWLVRGGIGIPLSPFEELSERDRNLHLAYADAVLALTRPECGGDDVV